MLEALSTMPWIVGPIVVPLATATLLSAGGQRRLRWVILATATLLLTSVGGLIWQVWGHGPICHTVGGWGAPLGIDLHADGLALVMLLMSIVVGIGVSLYALGYFTVESTATSTQTDPHDDRHTFFWPLWMFLWAALHALFLSADLFNIYVTLELMGLAAVGLVILAGSRTALIAGMRYVLTSFVASLAYLLGVALLYVGFGTLDMASLHARMTSTVISTTAIGLLTVGLLLKTALFPLHFWLPPAHASAPAPVSAVLSALVVKASFYLLLRLWFQIFPTIVTISSSQILGVLGATAIIMGSVVAIRQQRLKLLIAYSTVAQIGYLFLLFPLTTSPAYAFDAWSGGLYHAVSHACAKAAMFLAAGTMMHARGHDRIADLAGISHSVPLSVFAFAVAGVSVMGLPPSGGFLAKWLLLTASIGSGQWWWAVVIVTGGLLAAVYVFVVLRLMFLEGPPLTAPVPPIPRSMEVLPLCLALLAVLLGVISAPLVALLGIGTPEFAR